MYELAYGSSRLLEALYKVYGVYSRDRFSVMFQIRLIIAARRDLTVLSVNEDAEGGGGKNAVSLLQNTYNNVLQKVCSTVCDIRAISQCSQHNTQSRVNTFRFMDSLQ